MAGYKIQERIGIGGMGEVYKAFHPGLNRVAAIKILYQNDMAERFKNEAYIQSSVSHPNIAKLYEYIQYGTTPCIIMEYVEGYSLDAYILKKGRLDNEETENILGQIAAALVYLHDKDILHRDIKPQNFKVERDGTVKMLDFGISKNKYTPKLTQLGFVVGTTEYMAPEQFHQEVNKKSDIWSLGVMTYEMLTGHLPFDASNPFSLRAKIIKASFTDPKIFVPQLSPKLATIIDRTLRTNVSSRMSAAEIEELLVGKKQRSREQISWIKKIKKPQGQQWIYLGLLIGFVCFLIAMINLRRPNGPDSIPVMVPDPQQQEVPIKLTKLTIRVPSIPDATIVLPDGSRHAAPYEVSGKEGQAINFIIQAEGYADKKVNGLQFTPRRSTYEYTLEKIN
jgi:serine/threonine-protein kinase